MHQIPPHLLEEAEDLVLELSETDRDDKEATIRAVAEFLDAIFPFDVMLPAPVGPLVEKQDEAFFSLLIHQLTRVLHVDPAKKAERQLRRQQRREERQRRREEKRLAKENSDAR